MFTAAPITVAQKICQKGRQHKAGHGEDNQGTIFHSIGQQGVIGAEQAVDLFLKKIGPRPDQDRQQSHQEQGRGIICIPLLLTPAALRSAHQHRAAYAAEQPREGCDGENRQQHRAGRCPVWADALADGDGIHKAVQRDHQRTPDGGDKEF